MTNPKHTESGEAVSCFHEAYQGFCAHCGVKIINGLAQVPRRAHPTAAPAQDKIMVAVDALEKAQAGYVVLRTMLKLSGLSGGYETALEHINTINQALAALKAALPTAQDGGGDV